MQLSEDGSGTSDDNQEGDNGTEGGDDVDRPSTTEDNVRCKEEGCARRARENGQCDQHSTPEKRGRKRQRPRPKDVIKFAGDLPDYLWKWHDRFEDFQLESKERRDALRSGLSGHPALREATRRCHTAEEVAKELTRIIGNESASEGRHGRGHDRTAGLSEEKEANKTP
jgi:hypothetical protein